MRTPSSLLRTGLLPLAAAVSALLFWTSLSPAGAPERELRLLPLVLNEVRSPRTVSAHLVVDLAWAGEQAELRALRVRSGDDLLHEEQLAQRLAGDPRFSTAQALLERLPVELTELHRERRYFAGAGEPEFEGAEVVERQRELAARVAELRAHLAGGGASSFVELAFPLHLDQLFFADDPPGSERALTLEVDYRLSDGSARTAAVSEAVRLLPALLGPPQSLPASLGVVTVHAGDLHVHSCHGEAVNACAPSTDCDAESFQTSGSFTYAELRAQYQALGMDWFTATDHSYCINSASEYQTIVAECAALTDATFVVAPDTELSSDEVGPQIGSDSANLLCLLGSPQNHMGAHDIAQRVPGGTDGFLGFCNGFGTDALADFLGNVAAIRAQGGYPIVNHPTASAFAWNSFAATQGIEANGLHGVEIWNGATQVGQGGHVGRWVDWLLAGRILYAYSGSDTHDEAFAFGANHALLLNQPFGRASLSAAVRAGRVYVSNGPSAVIEVEVGGQSLWMGTLQQLPANPPAAPLRVRVHYELGAAPSRVTIFRGRVGDASESVLCQSALLTGSGAFECLDALQTGGRSWYRAYVESQDATLTAYTNPVFFLEAGADPLAYCTAKTNSRGCTPAIGWSGTPSATSPAPFLVTASAVLNNQNGILFYGGAPAFVPFQDGTRCVANPIARTPIQNAGGNPPPADCSGTYAFDFNAWIRSGPDPSLLPGTTVYAQFWSRDPGSPSTTGLSDALQFTIGP